MNEMLALQCFARTYIEIVQIVMQIIRNNTFKQIRESWWQIYIYIYCTYLCVPTYFMHDYHYIQIWYKSVAFSTFIHACIHMRIYVHTYTVARINIRTPFKTE